MQTKMAVLGSLKNGTLLAMLLLHVRADIALQDACKMDNNDPLISCTYVEKGTYGSSRLDRSPTRISFDRLTDSLVSLKNLPNVNLVHVQEALFDNRQPCQLIVGNLKPVLVALGNLMPKSCPADVSWTTYSDVETDSTATKTVETTRTVAKFDTRTTAMEKETTAPLEKETTEQPEKKTSAPSTWSTTDDSTDIIIIVIASSSAIVILIFMIMICCIHRYCVRRRRSSLDQLELGVRFGQLPRVAESSEETLFEATSSSKRD